MSTRRLLVVLLTFAALAQAQMVHTPKPGSAERQAICDAARAYVLSKYATRPLPQPIVFKIDRLSVLGAYANMQAVALLKDGSYAAPNYLPDMALNFCLRNAGSGWTVIADLSRTDVPDAAEAAAIRSRLPDDFPLRLLSPDWQKLLGR
jgi:hypothetical protein